MVLYRDFFFHYENMPMQYRDVKTLIVGTQRGGSNEYPQSMFWIKNKENRNIPVDSSFTTQKLGTRVYTLNEYVFLVLGVYNSYRY